MIGFLNAGRRERAKESEKLNTSGPEDCVPLENLSKSEEEAGGVEEESEMEEGWRKTKEEVSIRADGG